MTQQKKNVSLVINVPLRSEQFPILGKKILDFFCGIIDTRTVKSQVISTDLARYVSILLADIHPCNYVHICL